MHTAFIILIAISSVLTVLARFQDELNVDIDSIVADPKKSDSLYNCIMDQGFCKLEESIIRALIRGAFVLCGNVPPYVKKYVHYLAENDEDRFYELAGKLDNEDGLFRKLYCNRNKS